MKKRLFQDKVILITGASSGIGKALASELARQGAHLILTARRKERLADITNLIVENGGIALPCVCDVNKEEDIHHAVSEAHDKLGLIDIAIANAAIPMTGNFEILTLDDYRRQFETNVFGLLRTVYACLDDLKKTRGTLVIIGSTTSYISFPGSSAYNMSKFAVRAYAEAMYSELDSYGINVVLITPGWVESEIRLVDNNGIYHRDRKDWVPKWLVMPADKAAQKIAKAIYKRKREKFITVHGYIGYWIRQYIPWLYFYTLGISKKWKESKSRGQSLQYRSQI